MQAKPSHSVVGFLWAALALGGWSSLALPACHAQATGPNSGNTAAGSRYKGVKACRLCHQRQIRDLDPDPDNSFVLLNEPEIWLTDPHSKAFTFIDWSENADTPGRRLSQAICAKLGIADIHQAQQCLSCHANWQAGQQRPPLYQAGVGCESCHGPSRDWETAHRETSWRALPVADKAALGMLDVRNPIKRAEQCFSCHIGNVAQGKHLTHAMFAAGHPPLPSIEIESFAKQMPRHWRYLEEKIAARQPGAGPAEAAQPPFKFFDDFVRENHLYLKPSGAAAAPRILEHNHGAAAVVLGGVVAMREATELTRDLARVSPDNGTPWPELSAFDCTACHHDLKKPSWRQSQQAGRRPGRPAMHAWPTALVRLAIFHIWTDRPSYKQKLAEFETRLATVEDVFQATPFGDPDEIQDAASDFCQWLSDELITPVANKPFDNQAVQRSCKMLAHIGSTERQDYDSARQIAWALRTLYCDLTAKPAGDPQIRNLLGQLSSELRLDLPNSQEDFCDATAARRNPPVELAESVRAALAAEVQFDSARFMNTMKKFGSLLK